jgi:hypothetical protein
VLVLHRSLLGGGCVLGFSFLCVVFLLGIASGCSELFAGGMSRPFSEGGGVRVASSRLHWCFVLAPGCCQVWKALGISRRVVFLMFRRL